MRHQAIPEPIDRRPGTKEKKMKFKPSAYQSAIFTWVEKGSGSAVVNAVAGSGKTTTIRESLPFIPARCSVQLLAFNNSAAKDLGAAIQKLAERLAEERGEAIDRFKNVRAKTFHSLGFGAVCKKLSKSPQQIVTNGNKVRDIARQTLGDLDYELYADFSVRLVAYAKGQGVGPLCPDTDAAWYDLITHHDLYLDHEEATEARAVEIARDLLRRSNLQAADQAQPVIDYDDMLYMPLVWRCRLWQNDWVIVDEAQDTNPVRRALAKLALRPGGRLMAYGDRKQAIYGFTGASTDALDLIAREFRCAELPLTVSYRCPKAVAAKVQELVPYFEVPETAIEGEVGTITFDQLKGLGTRDAILCRQTAPLVETAFKLIARGVGCVVLGKEIGNGLINLVKKQKAKGVDALAGKLEAYRAREVAKHMAKGEEGKAEAVHDRVDCLMVVMENLPETDRTVPALIRRLEDLFSDTSNVLTLSTVHKVKGREYGTVAVLRPELSPSKWARQDWQYEQELNLIYVRDTRAMDRLLMITDGPAPRRAPAQEAEVVS
jgi:DNA helicase II / ATP-dependent DNA helicase PcrA